MYYKGANYDLEMQTLKKNLQYQSRKRKIRRRKRTYRKKRRRRHRVNTVLKTKNKLSKNILIIIHMMEKSRLTLLIFFSFDITDQTGKNHEEIET